MDFVRAVFQVGVSFSYKIQMECPGCPLCHPNKSPPSRIDSTSGEVIDSALLVQTYRDTVADFQKNLKFVTRLEHQISIPKLSNEVYCILPSHSVQINDNRTIKLVFQKCDKCKLCLEVNGARLNNVPSAVNVNMKDVNSRDTYLNMK